MAEMNLTSRIFVPGHRGLVGSAVLRRLDQLGYETVLTATRDQLDLRDQAAARPERGVERRRRSMPSRRVNYWIQAAHV